MLKFFRRIRQKLIEEGNLKRYLIYAIGEIFLVMIGILLALQVNNWKQKKVNNRLEKNYLKRLQKDLRKDSIKLKEHYQLLNTKAEILRFINIGDLDSIKYHRIFATRSIYPANIITATIDEMISSGNISILKNIRARDSIINYYNITSRQAKILSNNLSEWPSVISELIPGEMGLYSRSGLKKPSHEQVIELKSNLKNNLQKLKPIINAELNHTGLQYSYNMGTIDYNKKLLNIVTNELTN